MLSGRRRSGLVTRGLWALLLCLLLAPLARADDEVASLTPCECRDCLKLLKLSALAEGKLYQDRLPLALKTLNETIERYKNDQTYRDSFDGKSRIFFCELWGTVEDELGVVRDYQIPQEQKKLFANDMRCLPKIGGSTDPASCEIDADMMLINEVTSPCQQVHLAVLAHELVHVKDCQSQKLKPTWKNQAGGSCKEAFAGKTTPTPEQVVQFVQQTFDTELHAHKVESEVEALLINELNKQCSPNDYSTRMTRNPKYQEAVAFLQRARNYKYPAGK